MRGEREITNLEGRSFNDLIICVQVVWGWCCCSRLVGETEMRYSEIKEELVRTIALLALGVPIELHLRLVHFNVPVTMHQAMGYIFR